MAIIPGAFLSGIWRGVAAAWEADQQLAGTVYDETGRDITIAAAIALSDIQRYRELGLQVGAIAVLATTEAQHYQDLGLVVPVSAVLAAADAQHYQETGRQVDVTAVLDQVVAQHYSETGLQVNAAAVLALTDVRKYSEVGLQVTVQGLLAITEELSLREDLSLVAVAQVNVGDFAHRLEDALPVQATIIAGVGDSQRYAETLQVLIAAAVTATDAQRYREDLLNLATGAVSLTEAQHYREVGLATIDAVALVSVVDTLRQSRTGVPFFEFAAPALVRQYELPAMPLLAGPGQPRSFAHELDRIAIAGAVGRLFS